ncbi:MAG: hypothetical protein QOH48_1688 [Actinomycetota bacterium]|nr:hypothetical protein [Actinomycetota bacterium]
MIPRNKEIVLSAVIVVLIALGLAYGSLVPSVSRARLADTVPLSANGFASRAVYCPPSVTQMHDTTRIALTSLDTGSVPVSVGPAATPTPAPIPTVGGPAPIPTVGGSGQPQASPSPTPSATTPHPSGQQPRPISPGRARFEVSGRDSSVNVVGYGGAVVANAVTAGRTGIDAVPCSEVAGTRWYFGEGSSDLGYDERLILYNPFPDEAVVRVSFITPKGKETKANLTDHAVPSGATSVLRLDRFVLKERLLSVEVDAVRGRVVAWRSSQVHAARRPHGQQLSLGATQSHTEWFLPAGEIGSGYDERIALFNPNQKAARVSISLMTPTKTVQPAKLLDITVPPASSKSVALAAAVKACRTQRCPIGAVVSSTNGVGVVAERTIWYSTSHIQGVASETAASTTALRWYLGPASFHPTRDSVFVLNPTTADATVSLKLETDRHGPRSPAPLQHMKVKAGTRVEVRIDRWTSGKPVVVLLSSDQQVVAERFSYSVRARDASAVMGTALP